MLKEIRKKISGLGLPSPKSQGMTFLFILAFLGIFELALQSNTLIRVLPFPSPSFETRYPEIGVKFQRLFQVKEINCLFIGSSMIDAGLDPVIFEQGLEKVTGVKNTCFNMGLAGVQTEASTAIATTITNWHPVKIVVIGLSPLDLSSDYSKTRLLARMPVFTYFGGNPSFEGWMFSHLRFPWYFASLPRSSDLAYLSEQVEWDELLTGQGFRQTGEVNEVRLKDQSVTLMDFKINPVKEFMDQNGIQFIQSQDIISTIVTDTDWYNRNHLNKSGAEKFTKYVLTEIQSAGVVK
jgi:hypothetical protein